MTNSEINTHFQFPARMRRAAAICLRAFAGPILLTSGMLVTAPESVHAESLSAEQASIATALTESHFWSIPKSDARLHPLEIQTLSVEKQELKDHPAVRWISVYQYNYDARIARQIVVDLNANAVIESRPISSAHLPLNETEINFVKSLIEDDAALIELLRIDQTRRGVKPFESLSELDVKASIYEPTGNADGCRAERCALVSFFDNTRTVLNIEPIVNLNSMMIELLDK